MSDEKVHTEEAKQSFLRTYGGLVAFSLVTAFFSPPLLRYANPVPLSVAGMMLGFACWSAYRGSVLGKKGEMLKILLFGGGGLVLLVLVGQHSVAASLQNDALCRRLQISMVDAKPGQGDRAAVFEALGCRPQHHRPSDVLG
jgi:hypothetical protein